jgi:glutamine amidotransferase
MGNLYSVQRAIEYCGFEPKLESDPAKVWDAEILILPGVGAFEDAMKELEKRQLVKALQSYAQSGRPLLGICLGLQLLFDTAEEFGNHQGLGIIPGAVKAIANKGTNGAEHKIPHIGWNQIQPGTASPDWKDTILKDTPVGSDMYFVHSFAVEPTDKSHQLAFADYDGCEVTGVVKKDNIYGCQFHPEKSGPVGLQILKNYLDLNSPN